MASQSLYEYPHRRYNPLTGEWVLVSSHRTKRPWQGKQEIQSDIELLTYDPGCYLCPGNKRANGKSNPHYDHTYVFDNDFSALLPKIKNFTQNENELVIAESVEGICKVICFSPRHDITLPEMEHVEIMRVVDLWVAQYRELSHTYKWVQIFENKGEIMGCSNPHPHGQIWASNTLPNEAKKELIHQKEYYERNNTILLYQYAKLEIEKRERIVAENDQWVVLVPYWAIWPFETLVLPKVKKSRLSDLTNDEKDSLGRILSILLSKYDNLFNVTFPYTMGWHNAPVDDNNHEYWLLHAHYYPPLLRSANVKKFMVGYEMLSESQRDITPEQAASMLRDLSDIHFMKRKV